MTAWTHARVEVPARRLLDRIAASGADVSTDDDARAEAGRDWWPLAIGWAAEGAVPQRPAAVVRPSTDRAGRRRAGGLQRRRRAGDRPRRDAAASAAGPSPCTAASRST